MFCPTFGPKTLFFGPKTLILGQFVLFLCLYIQHKWENLCFLYFPNFITQRAILFITIYRKFEISSTWGFKIRLIYINFDENWHFFTIFGKKFIFWSNYKMKALNFMFYMSYWSLSSFLPNDTMFDRWYGCFVLILGQKHCFLGQEHWFWVNLCYFWVYTYSTNEKIYVFIIFQTLLHNVPYYLSQFIENLRFLALGVLK